MNSIDLTPLYRSSVGFDRLGSLLDNALRGNQTSVGYPPYNIELIEENRYAISIAVAGFTRDELQIQVENGVLSVRGNKADDKVPHRYLYQGIASRSFERKFNLAEFIEVRTADLKDGLLTLSLAKEIPEAMKPRTIAISPDSEGAENKLESSVAA